MQTECMSLKIQTFETMPQCIYVGIFVVYQYHKARTCHTVDLHSHICCFNMGSLLSNSRNGQTSKKKDIFNV